jgi:hypothetical protein
MARLVAARTVFTVAVLLSLTACGGHNGSPGLPLLPQPQNGFLDRRLAPAPQQSFAPSAFMANTSVGIHALQVFDEAHGYIITEAQGIADGLRYESVWGVRNKRMASAWHTGNGNLRALIYTPYDTDATGSGLDQPTSWWLANHPNWVLYECDKTTIAYVPGLHGVPLDISNPAVMRYQTALLGTFAETNGFNGVAADIVSLTNNTGHAASGHGGCGIWTHAHSTWVAKFSGNSVDPQWAAATKQWVWALQHALHNPARYPRTLALAVNANLDGYAPPVNGKGGDPDEAFIVAHADIILNEAGFAMWGNYAGDRAFNNAVGWMEYAQSLAEATLTTADWDHQSGPPTLGQLDYSIATYLMGKEQAAALYVGQNPMYGKENYYAEYAAKIGQGCAPMYGGPNDPKFRGENVYLRKYSGGLAVVNVNGKEPYVVDLPKASYRNIEGGNITSPLTVPPNSGFVLLTSNGCA